MTETTHDLQTVVDVATRAAAPHELTPGSIYALVDNDGKIHELNLDRDEYRDTPRRKKGTVIAHDANAFTTYVGKHRLASTEVWADEEGTRVVAVLNAHQESDSQIDAGPAGWSDHRVLYAVRKTDAWKAWLAHDRIWHTQTDFAEHIEDRVIDIVNPTGATMLELAQSISGTVGVTFESSKRLSTGEGRLEFKETVDAKAGHRGQLDIPETIELALVPFQGAPAYKVKARFRYRINGGKLALSYALERPEDVIREAFADVISSIAADVDAPVLMGWPDPRG